MIEVYFKNEEDFLLSEDEDFSPEEYLPKYYYNDGNWRLWKGIGTHSNLESVFKCCTFTRYNSYVYTTKLTKFSKVFYIKFYDTESKSFLNNELTSPWYVGLNS